MPTTKQQPIHTAPVIRSTAPPPSAPVLPATTSSATLPVAAPQVIRPPARTAPTAHARVTSGVSSPPPPASTRAVRALRALTFGQLAAEARTLHLSASATSPDDGLLIVGATILFLIVLGEIGFLTASVRLLRQRAF